MRLNSIRIRNLLQYREFQYEFEPGLTGIIGPNGVGKSNLLRIIKLLLLGSIPGEPGGKVTIPQMVTWGEKEGEAELDFSIGGTNCSAKRSITENGSSVALRVGAEDYMRPSEGYSKLFELVNAPPRMVESVAFAEQGEIGAMLFGATATRKDLFHRLFNVQIAESSRNLLKEEANYVKIDDSESTLEMLKAQLATAKEEQAEVTAAISKLPEPDVDEKQALEAKVRTFETRMDERRAVRDELSKLNIAETDGVVLNLRTLIEAGRMKVTEIAPFRPKLHRVMRLYDEQSAKRQQKRTREVQVKKFDRDLESSLPADVESLRGAIQGFKEEGEDLRREYLRQTQLLSAFSKDEGKCPTCLQDLEELPEDVNDERCAEVRARLERSSTMLDDASKRLEAAIRNDTKKKELLRLREEALADLEEINKTKFVGDDEMVEATAKIAEITKIEEDIRMREAKLEGAIELLAEKRRRHEELQGKLNTLEAVREDEYNAAVEALSRMRRDEERLAGLGGQAEICRRQVNRLQDSVDALKIKVRANRVRKTYRSKLDKARDDLHRDKLPAYTARTFMQAVNSSLAESISDFQLGFSAWIDPGTFAPMFMQASSREPQPHYLLSKGQRTALAVSFSVALWKTFLPTCDLLVLDEPTVWLDRERVSALADLLGTIRNWCEQTQSQFLVVTHDERLRGAMDRIIDLTQ